MMFEPIAIIGRSCLLPGALTPTQLWENVLSGKNCLSEAQEDVWKVDPKKILAKDYLPSNEFTYSIQGGYVNDFDQHFNPDGYFLPAEQIQQMGPLFQWLFHSAREAIVDAHYSIEKLAQIQAGAIIGNLSYPSATLSRYAESVWLEKQGHFLVQRPADANRFMSGLPAHLLAKAIGLKRPSYCIDAACASSLYAIKLACDELQAKRADVMLAGGINAADGLILHMGFSTLQALSRTGQSRPLHCEADGLLPAHGAAIVVLKRLSNAIEHKNPILGVIRGIGLSNDGRKRSFLVSEVAAQLSSMKKAYAMSGLQPEDIDYLECHATGTAVGDAVEVDGIKSLFSHNHSLTLGAIKGNIGHTITASAGAALINVLSAFSEKTLPPIRAAASNPCEGLRNSSFQLLQQEQTWEKNTLPYRAAINSFGFGGNNAHLIVESYQKKQYPSIKQNTKLKDKIAIVGIEVMAASANNKNEFWDAVLNNRPAHHTMGRIDSLELPIQETHFQPNDLKQTLGQQLLILKVVQQLLNNVNIIDLEKTSAFIGMQCDAEQCHHVLRWRLPTLFPQASQDWLQRASAQIGDRLGPAYALGAMPNVVTNRLNAQFNFQGPSHSVSAEELGGVRALQIAINGLRHNEIDTAIVGAVDACCEVVHASAAQQVLAKQPYIPGDGAVALVLKRLQDAQREGDEVMAIVDDNEIEDVTLNINNQDGYLTSLFGHAHAAMGLLYVAAATLGCSAKCFPKKWSSVQTPLSSPKVALSIHALEGQSAQVYLQGIA